MIAGGGSSHVVLSMDGPPVIDPVVIHKKRVADTRATPGYESINEPVTKAHPDAVTETPKKRIPGAGASSIVLG